MAVDTSAAEVDFVCPNGEGYDVAVRAFDVDSNTDKTSFLDFDIAVY